MAQDKILALTHHLSANNEVERSILDQILKPVLNETTQTILNYWIVEKFRNEKGADQYITVIRKTCLRLMQAYQHQKNYKIVEDKITKDVKKEIAKKRFYIDERWYKLELNCEVDAFLTKWKSTLDSLAKSLIPIFNTKALTFERSEKYSFRFLGELENNLPDDIKRKTIELSKFVKDKSDTLHKMIKLRDDIVHFDKELLTPYHYHLKENKLFMPNLLWEDRWFSPEEFMLFATEFLKDFIKDFILLSLNNLESNLKLFISDSGYEWREGHNKVGGVAIYEK